MTAEEFVRVILDKLHALEPVYNCVDRDGFSVVDIAINGEDESPEGFRVVVSKLPRIFEDDEKTAEFAARLFDKNA